MTHLHSPHALERVAPLSQTLHRLDEAHRRFRAHVAKSFTLSGTELTALLLIVDAPGISPGAMAEDLGITSGAVTAIIDRLEDAGLAHRTPGRNDRRRLELHLTESGQDTLTKMRTAYRTVLGEADTDGALTAILPQLDSITTTLNAAAKNHYPAIP